jgi:hypothetical protein
MGKIIHDTDISLFKVKGRLLLKLPGNKYSFSLTLELLYTFKSTNKAKKSPSLVKAEMH